MVTSKDHSAGTDAVTVPEGDARKTPPFGSYLRRQRITGNLIFPFIAPLLSVVLRVLMFYRVRDRFRVRDQYRSWVKDHPSLLICANHLTMIDSAILLWALGSNSFYTLHFNKFAWNVPAVEHFGHSLILRALLYLTKCIPINRRGSAEHREEVTAKIDWLLRTGDPIMLFPEGRRSLTGRIDTEGAAYGPGLLVQRNPDTAVLCIYLRGDAQRHSSTIPAWGEKFSLRMRLITPATEQKGLRGQKDLAGQILSELQLLEAEFFAAS